LAGKCIVGAVHFEFFWRDNVLIEILGAAGVTAASTNHFCRGGPTNTFLGTSRLYKSICRDGVVGAAGKTAFTNHRQSPLQMLTVVVQDTMAVIISRP
jgi:hypothetical protein